MLGTLQEPFDLKGAGFTYIRPLMEQVTHLSVGAITAILLGYGIGGFFGNFAGGAIAGPITASVTTVASASTLSAICRGVRPRVWAS